MSGTFPSSISLKTKIRKRINNRPELGNTEHKTKSFQYDIQTMRSANPFSALYSLHTMHWTLDKYRLCSDASCSTVDLSFVFLLPDGDPVPAVSTGHQRLEVVPAAVGGRSLVDALRLALQQAGRDVPVQERQPLEQEPTSLLHTLPDRDRGYILSTRHSCTIRDRGYTLSTRQSTQLYHPHTS